MREHGHIATQRGDAQEPAKYPKEHRRNDPEPSSNSNIPQQPTDGMPMISENDEDRSATTPHARHYQNEQEPFIEKGDHIKAHPVRIGRRAQLICKNPMPDRPTAYRGKHQNRVEWASSRCVTF
jgi:hypothetical protein